jgi:diadenosine tetraphosphatase ApaH/serine/threonine PP2A family protein phosphatase
MSWLFRRTPAPAQPGAAPPIAPDLRIYAVGDVHGRADLLHRLHAMIAADAIAAPEPRRRLVYLGDYVDRGPDSSRVLDLLTEAPLDGFERVCLKGNHEDAMLRFLSDEITIAPTWFGFGGARTLESYGLAVPDPADAFALMQTQRQLAAVLPIAHHRFLRQLATVHAEGGFLFAHAGVRPGVPLDRQSEDDLIWIRAPFLQSSAAFGSIVVHGHSVAREVEFRPNRIGIDTGAYATGRLTCLVIAPGGMSLLQT